MQFDDMPKQTELHTAELEDISGARIIIRKRTWPELHLEIAKLTTIYNCRLVAAY